MATYTDIAFPTAVRKTFTYHVPGRLQASVEPGKRVWVPLRDHMAIGMVVRVHQEAPDFTTRPVERVLDQQPVMRKELLELTHWLHRFYYSSYGEAIQSALPVGLNFQSKLYLYVNPAANRMGLDAAAQEIIRVVDEEQRYSYDEAMRRWKEHRGLIEKLVKRKILQIWEEPEMQMKPREEKVWYWTERATFERLDELIDGYKQKSKLPKWVASLEKLRSLELPALQKTLLNREEFSPYALKRIHQEGLIYAACEEITKIAPRLEYDPGRLKSLNEEQEQVMEPVRQALDNSEFARFMLYGVTGSGKTEIYIHALKKVREQGKSAIILVPEIALTPQTVRRFFQIFGDDIAVIHSRLTDRERYDAWLALHNGEKHIAIGARSAIFAPVTNLGLVVLDEEHDSSYKQEDPAPRYHAREVAIMRAYNNNAVFMGGSATPSMISYRRTFTGKIDWLTLKSRHANIPMPEVQVIDLKQYKGAMRGPLSVPLYESVSGALERNEQIILLLNRRGFASFLQCEDCGHIVECPNCSVSLTYHKNQHQIRCHYCGYTHTANINCPACNSRHLEKHGTGTQNMEEEIKELFPEARTVRMDQDTTQQRDAHERLLGLFDRQEADILLGTQLVAKGLDFPNVTVVGVINADTELAFPSFQSSERMFQLLSQVAGRSGRTAEKTGKVFIQSWQPEHKSVQFAKRHDYLNFARQELEYRKNLDYPPFSRLINIMFKSKDPNLVGQVAEVFSQALRTKSGGYPVLGPSPAAVYRMQRFFRWEAIVKIPLGLAQDGIEELMDATFAYYETIKPEGASNVRINVNVDAIA